MLGWIGKRGGGGQGDPVGAARQDVLHGAVAGRAEVQGPRTGGLHARGPVGLAQAHEAQTRAIALLGMRMARQQRGDERGGRGARRLRPADEARGRPLGVRPMRVRHVGGLGGVLATAPASAMRGDAPAFEKQFDRGGAEADLDPLVHELVGDAVVVVLDEDVVVDVHAGVAPLGEFVPTGREWAEPRTIELLEQRAAGDAELPHRARVERREQFANGGVQLREAEEAAVAQHGQDPALGDEHVRLDRRLCRAGWPARAGPRPRRSVGRTPGRCG